MVTKLLLENPFIKECEKLECKKYVSFNELVNDLHTGSLTEVDYIKYGCDMVELISEHTNWYEIVEHYNPLLLYSIIEKSTRKEL